jgi:hypothetical protein
VAIVEVAPGVCGFCARIVSVADELGNVNLEITSDCQHIRQLAEQLTRISALEELGSAITDTATYRAAAGCRTHAACPVPSAILKAIEVAAGMALPADVQISIRRD